MGNRWWGPEGPKDCSSCVCSANRTSLALMRALMYQQLLYNSAAFSFEAGWLCAGNKLSPIGIHPKGGQNLCGPAAEGQQYPGRLGQPYHPVCGVGGPLCRLPAASPPLPRCGLLLWGNIPWERADLWTHGVFNVLYPGYETASYFHNESGFLTATPFGDSTDVLLSDAPLWLLQRYPVIVVGSALRVMRREVSLSWRPSSPGEACWRPMPSGLCTCLSSGPRVSRNAKPSEQGHL